MGAPTAAKLEDWVSRSETVTAEVAPVQAAMLAATLDMDRAPARGDPLPLLWHWLAGPPTARQSALGVDGHPARGGFLPPVALPRRMWAGSQLRFHAPLMVGEPLSRTSTITAVTTKAGRSGPLIFVDVMHEIAQANRTAMTEHQNIVYRDFPAPGDSASPPSAPPPAVPHDWRQDFAPDSVMLFRYSAATFNGHRIHYDRPYATGEEGYPGLVVHGPLTATLMMETLRRHVAGEVRSFEFRGLKPLFDGEPFGICGKAGDGGKVDLWVIDVWGEIAMRGGAEVAAW